MVKTLEDVEEVRGIASRLEEIGVPQKMIDRIRKWVRGEAKRLRNEAREHSH